MTGRTGLNKTRIASPSKFNKKPAFPKPKIDWKCVSGEGFASLDKKLN